MSTVVITVAGTDITNHVLYESAQFESQLGAVPGTFSLIVRDAERTLSFDTGQTISLDIDGHRYYGGFVTRVTRQFAFPYDKTTDISRLRSRQWLLEGVDWNILFDKRYCYNVANPIGKVPDFSTDLTDVQVINLLMDSYLNLSGDGISRDLSEVGDPTPSTDITQIGTFGWGEPWRINMEQIAAMTGAIWYIDPTKTLKYKALEDVAPAWYFSDRPNRVSTFGFRDFSYIHDATNLINDALVWGGAPLNTTGGTVVFGRATASDSISSHGRFERAETHFGEQGYYETANVQMHANVIVFGPPGAAGFGMDPNRGLQNPQRQLRLSWLSGTTPTPLYPGQVITTFLYTYGTASGGSITPLVVSLPLRQLQISFESPTIARFNGFCGIQTDDPWSMWKYLRSIRTAATQQPVTLISTSDGGTASVAAGTYVQAPFNETPDGARTVFHTKYPYVPLSIDIALNGLEQRTGHEFNETDPATGEITFTFTPASDDVLWTRFYASGA